jgi:hypothetical protein
MVFAAFRNDEYQPLCMIPIPDLALNTKTMPGEIRLPILIIDLLEVA